MGKKLNISDQEIKETILSEKSEIDAFSRKHLFNVNDPLVLILKAHLYIENLLNQLLSSILPNAEKIIKKRFLDKVDFIEALEIIPSDSKGNMIGKIRILHTMRNKFAHNLESTLDENDINQLAVGFARVEGDTNKKLKMSLHYIIGYLHATRTLYKLFPFYLSISTHEKIYKRDKGFNKAEVSATYPKEDFLIALEKMRM